MFVDVFIECLLDLTDELDVFCVLPIICNSQHSSFLVFYFNVSNKISSTPPRLSNFRFSNPPFLLALKSRPIWICKTKFYIDVHFFYFRPFFASFVQKSICHFGVAWLISQYFSHRGLKPVAFLDILYLPVIVWILFFQEI